MPTQTGVLSILVIDDDMGDRILCQRALKHAWGDTLQVLQAESGEIGLEMIANHKLDCVLLDYSLPGINGIEVLRLIRIKYPYLAVVMLDGKGDDAIAVQALQQGAQDYIPKANITAELIRRISKNAIEKTGLQHTVAQQQEELENFAGMLVHDLKAPTRAIQGFAAIIEQSISEGKLENIAEDCRHVVKSAQRMDTLIDTLRQYTKTNGRVVFGPVEMERALEDTLSNLEQLIRERGAQVTHSALPAVTGNASQLGQLLQNLIGNGIKYCKAKIPSIRIAASLQEKNTWLFTVKDNGLGIPRRHYLQVFEPFRRLHGSDEYEGTGLGLATCQKIIERHHGRIWCESGEGGGTTFSFTLQGVGSHG